MTFRSRILWLAAAITLATALGVLPHRGETESGGPVTPAGATADVEKAGVSSSAASAPLSRP